MPHPFTPKPTFSFLAVSLIISAGGLFAQTPVRHVPPGSYTEGQPLVLQADSGERLEWVMAFWKTPSADDYESLRFETRDGKSFSGRLEPSSLASQTLVYYLAYKTGDQIHYLPEEAPAAVYSLPALVPPSGAPVPKTSPPAPAGESPTPQPFPLHLDGTLETTVVKGESESTTHFVNSQNARLEYAGRTGAVEWTINTRLAYNNQPVPGENSVDLPELNLVATVGGHTLRAGDLSVSESEFSIASQGRRGLEYDFKTSLFEIHAFTVSTQVLSGFKGVGFPKSGASLFGGAAAVSPFKGFTLKAVVVSGEDDPTMGFNVGTSAIYQKRKGSVVSFIGESVFFQEALNVQAEYALSNYDGDLSDGETLVPGKAFRVQGAFRHGVFDAQVGYRSIGKDFNTVGLPFLLNDRRGFQGTAGVSLGKFRVGGGFRTEETNVDDDPDLVAARLIAGQGDVSYSFGESSSVRFGFTRESQDAQFSSGIWNPYPAFQGTLDKTGFTGGLDLGLKPWLRLSVSGEQSALRCDQTPAMNGDQTTASFGIQVMLPEQFMLFPYFSYSRIAPADGAATRSMTASLNGELTIIRKWLTWNVTAALGDTATGDDEPVRSMFADSGINLNLRPIISLGDLIISIRGQYQHTRMSGLATNDFRATVRLTEAF